MNTIILYIDPATTSYIIQIGAAVLVSLGTCLAIFWNKITRIFRKKKDNEPVEKKMTANTNEKKDVVIKAEDLLDD